ncbi:MAG: hypothetical protein ACRCSP_04140, partial [Rhodoglobus sp.]
YLPGAVSGLRLRSSICNGFPEARSLIRTSSLRRYGRTTAEATTADPTITAEKATPNNDTAIINQIIIKDRPLR